MPKPVSHWNFHKFDYSHISQGPVNWYNQAIVKENNSICHSKFYFLYPVITDVGHTEIKQLNAT